MPENRNQVAYPLDHLEEPKANRVHVTHFNYQIAQMVMKHSFLKRKKQKFSCARERESRLKFGKKFIQINGLKRLKKCRKSGRGEGTGRKAGSTFLSVVPRKHSL